MCDIDSAPRAGEIVIPMISLQGNVEKAFKNKDFETETLPLSKQTTDLPFPRLIGSFFYPILHLHKPNHLLQMKWLRPLFSPMKKLRFRFNSTRRKSRGIYILYEDVKSCPYEDVHVLWSMLTVSRKLQSFETKGKGKSSGITISRRKRTGKEDIKYSNKNSNEQ